MYKITFIAGLHIVHRSYLSLKFAQWLVQKDQVSSHETGPKVSFTVVFPEGHTDRDYLNQHTPVVCDRKRIKQLWPCVVCFMRREMDCDSVHVSVEGRSWYVCELGGVCTLWHCHWSSLASCSVMQGTDKDFIQLFLTHKHTSLCPSFACIHKSSFQA